MNDKRDLLNFIERIINLKDKALRRQYYEYRQQLDKEGKIVYEHFLKEIEEEVVEQRGIEKGKREMARNLLANGIPLDIIAQDVQVPRSAGRAGAAIAQSAGVPVEQIQNLIN
jgi:flagellar motor switch protein FliG